MQTILEYIMMNYTWIIVGSIIILLAIIGYYADTTNFGQGKTKENENKDVADINSLEGKRMEDLLQKNKDVSNALSGTSENNNAIVAPTIYNNNPEQNPNILNNFNYNVGNNNVPINQTTPNNNVVINNELLQNVGNINTTNVNSQIDAINQSEANFKKFDEEFNELLPKKEIISNDLLDDINDMSFDKTQKIQISDIQHVDDVELPKIKTLPAEEDDIWKF